MRPIDWTLLCIAEAGNQPLQPVQLQKALFLLGRNLPLSRLKAETFYSFEPYDYGPFAAGVYRDAEALEQGGLVTIKRPPLTRFNQYSSTDAGRETAASLRKELPADVAKYLTDVIKFTQSLSFNELVAAIYKAYPDMKANSVFQG